MKWVKRIIQDVEELRSHMDLLPPSARDALEDLQLAITDMTWWLGMTEDGEISRTYFERQYEEVEKILRDFLLSGEAHRLIRSEEKWSDTMASLLPRCRNLVEFGVLYSTLPLLTGCQIFQSVGGPVFDAILLLADSELSKRREDE